MNHYDGPAFYRKFVHDGTINKDKKVNAMRQRKFKYSHGKQNVTGFSRDVQRANFNNFKPFKTSSSHIDLQNNPIAKITAEFQPRKHYGTLNNRNTPQSSNASSVEFHRISTHYHKLISELSPDDQDVTLLASSSEVSNDQQREGSLHFKLASNSDQINNSQNLTSSEDDSAEGTQAKSPFVHQSSQSIKPSLNSESFELKISENEMASTKSQNSGNARSYRNFDSNESGSEELKDSVKSNVSQINDHKSSEELKSSENEVTTINEKSGEHQSTESLSNSVTSSNNLDNSEPLGHNISSIMQDEGEDIKTNLDLFKRSNSATSDSKSHNDNNQDHESIGSSTEIDSTQNSSDNVVSSSTSNSNNDNVQRDENSKTGNSLGVNDQSQFGQHPDFVAQNPTNVQPSNDFSESTGDSDENDHHEIQPSTISNYHFPNHDLLVAPKHYDDQGLDDWILNKAETLNKTLRAFNVNAQVVDWTNGPTVTQFQVKLHLGVKVSKINHLSDDLKMALAAKDIRIQAPIPGKTTCGIEIPNPKPHPVMLSEVVNSKTFKNSKSDLTIALGVDLTGKPRVTDLRKMPHGLIAGATGSGKSVFINCMLISLMYKATPQELKMILIDPKAVEFAPYNGIPYLLSPVISEPKQAAASLKWATKEMNQRYEKLAAAGVRNIEQFNQKAESHHQPQMKMPYILIVIDELADLMMVAGDEIETYIVRITQKARAAGIHLVVATQRPSVDVITGTMKNNIPTRVAFMVSSQVDSRTIIDQSGAERLLGKGDMLFLGNGSSHPIRLQGCYVSNQEIDKVAGFARHQEPAHYAFHPGSLLKHVSRIENQDKLMPQVLAYIAKEKTVSTSKLQRVFSIGYNRAAKIIDDLEQHGYISGQEGSKPRDVYLTEKDYKKLNL